MNILLTGAAGQLGEAYSLFLKSKGHNVFAVDLKLPDANNAHKVFSVDLSRENNIRELFSLLPQIDVLINNAGVGVFTPFEERTEEELDYVTRINLHAPILLAKYFAAQEDLMSGSIVNIASVYGIKSSDKRIYGNSKRNNSEIYSATKAGIIMLTKYLAAHLAERHINVNCISPGGVFRHQDEYFVKNYEDKTPFKRMGSADDLFGTIDYLISPENHYVTGINIPVDGGFTSW